MVSFEGMRHGSGDLGRAWRIARNSALIAGSAMAAAGIAFAAATALSSDERVDEPVVSPYPGLTTEIVPGLDALLALTQLPATYTSELPTAFTDNFELPAPEPAVEAPAPAPVVESRPLNSAPVTVPVEQSKPAPPPPPPPPAETSNFYLPAVPAGGITNLEQRLLDGINAERAKAGLGALAYDAGLSKIARIRVQQMADQGYFGHVDPYGYSMYTELLAKFGYGYAWAGENLALNNYNVAESPERAVIALMKSPTHAANILATDFSRIGIGEITTPEGRHIYAMIFLG